MIYFIQSGAKKFIKIGYTKNIDRRIKELQTGNPEKLILLGTLPGGFEFEKGLHDLYKYYRIRPDSEWFRIYGKLKPLVQLLKNDINICSSITNIKELQIAILKKQTMDRSEREKKKGKFELSNRINKIRKV